MDSVCVSAPSSLRHNRVLPVTSDQSEHTMADHVTGTGSECELKDSPVHGWVRRGIHVPVLQSPAPPAQQVVSHGVWAPPTLTKCLLPSPGTTQTSTSMRLSHGEKPGEGLLPFCPSPPSVSHPEPRLGLLLINPLVLRLPAPSAPPCSVSSFLLLHFFIPLCKTSAFLSAASDYFLSVDFSSSCRPSLHQPVYFPPLRRYVFPPI